MFHELAKHLKTRKLTAGEILFDGTNELPERDFYVVVDGLVQVFVKGQDYSDHASVNDEWEYREIWDGRHLLNEVKAGETVSSLFSILSVFTEDLELSTGFPAQQLSDDEHEHGLHEFSPKKRSKDKDESVFPSLESSPVVTTTAFSSPMDDSNPTTPHPDSLPKSSKHRKSVPQVLVHPNIIARAAQDTTLAVIPAEAFQKLTVKFPNAAAHIVQVILTSLQIFIQSCILIKYFY